MSALDQTIALSRRSVLATVRQPQNWVPGLFFPLMLAAVYTSQFARAVRLEGFPDVDSFLDFLVPASILQGVAFGANNGASELALDIENGFIDRLLASPVARSSILVGRLAGSAIFAALQAVFLMIVFVVFGARIAAGFPGAVVLVLVGVLLALAIGGIGCSLAFRTGSQEAIQSTFPLIFVLLFVSSAFFPTSLMEGWYGALARHNPITWIVDPTRRLVIEGFDWTDVGSALGITAAFAVASSLLALSQLRWRTRRL